MDYINIGLQRYTIILFISTLSFTAGSDINCNGKAFHCVNSTHFKICVDLGGGLSTTVDEFLIQCPRNTVCKQYNLFECEYEITTTLPPVTVQSEVTNEPFQTSDNSVWQQLDVTTIFPMKQQQGMGLSENYYNKVNVTPTSFTTSFLADVVINPVISSYGKDLYTSSNSDIKTTLNISRSINKELAFSTTAPGIDVTLASPNNINTLETDNVVGSKYNTENPVFFPTIQVRRTIDSFKSESLEPLNQNSSDLDVRLSVTKRTNQVSSLSELPFSVTVTLLPGNLNDQSLQENALRISNTNHLIKSDNTTQERNFDILIKYNTTQLKNSDNYTEYRNINSSMYSTNTSTDINTLNSTTLNVITHEIFTSNVSNINKQPKVDSLITTESPEHMSLYTAEAIENYDVSSVALTNPIVDENSTTPINRPQKSDTKSSNDNEILNLKNIFDVNFTTELNTVNITQYLTTPELYLFHERSKTPISSTSKSEITAPINISEVLYLSSKEATQVNNASQIDNIYTTESEFVSTINPKNQSNPSFLPLSNISLFTAAATKSATYDKIIVGDNSYTSVGMLPVLTKLEMSNGVTSLKPLSDFIVKNKISPEPVMMTVATELDNNNTTTRELNNNITAKISNGVTVTNSKPLSDLTVKNETSPKPVMMTVATDFDNNNITTTEVNNNITAKISHGVTNLKSLSDLIVKNETSPKPDMMTVATDLDNNNISTTEVNNNITAKISHGVTNLKSLSDLIVKNETSPKPDMMTVATDLDNNNITTTEVNNNITAEISNGVTNLKPLSDLTVKNETSPKPDMMTVATDLDNNNITTTEVNNNITAEICNGVTNLKRLSDLIVKNETSPKPVMMTVATDFDNNNTTTTEVNNNITAKISNGVTNLKPLSHLTVNNENSPKPVMMTIATQLDNNNITTTEVNNNITVKVSHRVTNLKPLSDLIVRNETSPKPVMMTIATELDNNNIATTEGNNNITAKISKGVTNLKPLSNLTVNNENSPKPVMMTIATQLDNNNIATTEGNNNITAKISKGVTNLKPLSNLTVNNENSPKPDMMTVATDLDNNNITTTEVNNNITAKISNGVTNFKPSSDLTVKNETSPKPVMMTVATDFDNNNTTTREVNNNITAKISNGVTNLKPLSHLTVNNENSPKPVMMTIATQLDNNNITTTEVNNNITVKVSHRVTNLKPLSNLTVNNENSPKPDMMTVATDLDNNNITTTEVNNNITAKISNGVTNFKPSSDLTVKNETSPKPVMMTVATDFDNNNTTTREVNNNITAKISNGVTNLKPLSDLTVKNETSPKPVMMTVATDFHNNNTTTREVNNNITAKISNGVANLKPLSDLTVKNETSPKPDMMTVATDLDNNNTTTTEVNNNITAKISNGVTNLKPLSDLTVKNETSPKPVMMTVATDFHNNNTTTREVNNNITAKISNGVTNLKPLSDLTVKNETSPKPVMMTVATDFHNNNTTTREVNNNITAKISNGVTNLKPLSDLTVKNETSPKPVMMTVATDFHNNNTTTREVNNNITAKISNGIANLKPLSDLTVKNETSPKPDMMTAATDLDNNNTTTTEVNNNITAKISNGVTNLKPLSDLTVKNETSPKPVMMTVATDLDNNNSTTTEVNNNITAKISNGVTNWKPLSDLTVKNETSPKPAMMTVATDLDNNNITTTETSYNIKAEIYNRVSTLNSISDLTSTSKNQGRVLKLLSVTNTFDSFHKKNVFDQQSLNDSNTSLSSFTKIPDYILKNKYLNTDSVALNPSIDSVINDLERNTTSIITSLPTALDKPTLLMDRNSGGLDNNNTTHNNDDTKSVINSLYEIYKALSSNSKLMNRTSDIYETITDSDKGYNRVVSLTSTAVFESDNSTDVTYNTIAVRDVLSEYRVVFNNNKNIENTSKLESTITKLSTYSYSNTSSKHVTSSETKNDTTLSPESTNKDINEKQVIYKNSSNNYKIFVKNSIGNPILTKLTTEDIHIPKLVTTNNFSLSVALNVTNTNNSITDKNNRSLKDIEVKHNLVTNDLVEKSLTEGVINRDLNYTDKNVVSSVSSNSESVPLTYSPSSLTKPPLTDIYNVSQSYFNENISRTLTFDKITASKKYNATEDKDSSQTNKNGLAPEHAISNVEHEENKSEYLLINKYKQVTTTAKKVNDTTLKELSYNYSEPSNDVKYDFIMENITTSADKRNAPNDFYDTNGSDFNKNMTNKSINVNNGTNRSELADYFQLSGISNRQLSGNIIKPLLIVQKPLEEVNNMTSLHTGNGNLKLITGYGFQGYVSDTINKSKTSEINNVNKSKLSTPVTNITSSKNFSKDILNNWGVVNITLVSDATKPSKTHNSNVPEGKNYTNNLNATSESSITANNLLRSTSSQTNSIKNKTHPAVSATALEISRTPSEFVKSSQPTGPLNILKMETTPFVFNKTKLELISKQEKNTISEHTNRSNRIEEKQLRNGQSTLTVGNGVTKKIRNNTKQHQNRFTTLISNNNYSDTKYRKLRKNLEFNCTKRGKYSDANDCNKFYVCNGRVKPIIAICPKDTVFSEYLKQCTKNITQCIRNNQFKCTSVGRFNNILCNNTYFICAKKNSRFIRFTLKCQKGYYLDKINTKCTPELINISISDENSSKNTNELSFDKSEDNGGLSVNSKNYFDCEKEGKFSDPHDCRKYYVCKKGRNSSFRRKIKKCDSDEVFHRKKKKCVDVESYECDT